MKGLIGKKIGMTQLYNDAGSVVPVTVVEAGPCVVLQKKQVDRDGYNALQLGFGPQKNQRVNKAMRGHMAKASQGSFKVLREFRVDDVSEYEVGQEIKVADLLKEGDKIDVAGFSKGRGYSGVIRRWSFGGFPSTHGTHEYFRHGGSIGNRSFPGKVFKGKPMAGHWGNERTTVQNLEVVGIRADENVLLIKGSVPGSRGGILLIHQSIKD